ncbi:MAG: glyoxalase [Flammeovirgaceae bacterium]|nr:glyoxalase [Flammeovirgaceae bacterium]MBE60900.1 glyoxalase [Flammeovirgaceae bacterium]
MADKLLYGIQQVGIGVTDIVEAEKWYAGALLANIKVLEDHHPATHMAPYMGGKPRNKSAVILINKNGGGGFELWQHTEHQPQNLEKPIQRGDLGINYITLLSGNLKGFTSHLEQLKIEHSAISQTEISIIDPFQNTIHIKESTLLDSSALTTGVKGCSIGVSDLESSLIFYQHFGYSLTGQSETDLTIECTLSSTIKSNGRFGAFFGHNEIVLIQRKDRNARKIFENRYWGDPGFIHLCFDVFNLKSWVKYFSEISPFTILSDENFRMGDAYGYWGYLEDPDGTLIEMVETHRIPIFKNLGIIINLKNKSPHKKVPKWLVQAMRLKKARH